MRLCCFLLLTGALACSPGAQQPRAPELPLGGTARSPAVASEQAAAREVDEPPTPLPQGQPAVSQSLQTEPPPRHPLADVEPDELERLLLEQPEALGSVSIGSPDHGALFNGVQLEASELFDPVDKENAWATEETRDYLTAAVARVHERFEQTPRLYLGHISAQGGRWLSPHKSHQSGRDADIGFFYKSGERWYRRATANNLDLPRTWTLVRALITETDVEMILMDHSISSLLREHALALGEDRTWLNWIFRGGSGQQALIRHERGHATHLHVRFYNPIAQESARLLYPLLVKHEMVREVPEYRQHRVVKGETLGKLAKRYGTTVVAIKRANGLRSTLIQAKKTYKIPVPAGSTHPTSPLRFPPRRLPQKAQPALEKASMAGQNAGG